MIPSVVSEVEVCLRRGRRELDIQRRDSTDTHFVELVIFPNDSLGADFSVNDAPVILIVVELQLNADLDGEAVGR